MGAQRILKTTTAVVVALVALELAARVWLEQRRPEETVKPWGHTSWPRSAAHFEPHPFTGFALNPAFLEHSEQGLREQRTYARDHAGVRILALGGSNTYGTQVRFEDAFPRLLESVLQDLGHPAVEVINAGVGAYSTANLIGHLALRMLDLDPEICVLDVGYTDAVTRIRYPGFRSDYSHDYRAWYRPERPFWRASVLLNGIARRLGFGFSDDPSIHDVAQWPYDPDFEANFAASSVEPFRRNLRSLVGLCLVHGVRPVLCTQAIDYSGHPSGPHDDLWIEAMRQSNEVIRELANEMSLDLVDLAAALDDQQELFADERRMNRAGNIRRAALVAGFLVEQGLLDPMSTDGGAER